MSWWVAFVWTITCELPLAAIAEPKGFAGRAARDSLVFNLTTHPFAWYAITHFEPPWIAVEVVVFGVEALLYTRVTGTGRRYGVRIAALANGVTATLSWLL